MGLTLTVLALVAIPVSNGSFNPARSIATAVWGGGVATEQLWMSILALLVGGALAGITTPYILGTTHRRDYRRKSMSTTSDQDGVS